MKKIWLSMFYSIRVREEPDSVFLKKKQRNSEPSQDDTDQLLLLAPKILPFPKELELHLFFISIQEFLCVSTPLRDPEKWTNSFSFLRNTYKIRHYKKDNGNPTINYFIYEFHSNRNTCPAETEFVTCYPLAQRAKIYLRGKDNSFGST